MAAFAFFPKGGIAICPPPASPRLFFHRLQDHPVLRCQRRIYEPPGRHASAKLATHQADGLLGIAPGAGFDVVLVRDRAAEHAMCCAVQIDDPQLQETARGELLRDYAPGLGHLRGILNQFLENDAI